MKYLPLLLILLFPIIVSAQITASMKDGFDDTYFYKINSKQALNVYQHSLKPNDTAVFSELSYIQKKGSDSLALPTGNYLKMNFDGSQIEYEYFPVMPWRVYVLDNKEDLIVQLLDLKMGKSLQSAIIKIGNQDLKWDDKIGAYTLSKYKKEATLSITDKDHTFYYRIQKNNFYRGNKNPINNFLSKQPFYYLASLYRFYTRGIPDGYLSLKKGHRYGVFEELIYNSNRLSQIFRKKKYNQNYNQNAFFYFNKPKYKQGDTIKFKAHLLENQIKGIWYDKPLLVFLDEDYNDKPIYLGRTTSRKKGAGYNFQFVIQDSMDIDLDDDYKIVLKNLDSVQMGVGTFTYEDYELKKSVFEIDLPDGEKQFKNIPFRLNFKAKDENGLPMPDTRATVEIITNKIYNIQPNQLFIPKKLWTHDFKITNGEQEFIIPDSIFPAANVNYELNVVMQNSENEITDLSKDIEFELQRCNLKMELLNDSIYVTKHEQDAKQIRLYAEDYFKNILLDTTINTPFSFAVNNHVNEYSCETDDDETSLDLHDFGSGIEINFNRTSDSIVFRLQNLRKLPFVYHLYKINKEIAKGTEKNFPFRVNSDENSLYYLLVEYVWAGKAETETRIIPLLKNIANLKITQPKVIAPGKETEVSVVATDYKGKPIKDLNLLAFAFTKKFEETEITSLPLLGIKFKRRQANNSFKLDTENSDTTLVLNYPFWNREMLLDTNWTYRFRYPSNNNIEYTTISVKDSITQIAPFVMDKGLPQAIQYVFIDNVPVYFGFTNIKAPYSFETDTNYHQIKIRTSKMLLTLDSIKVSPYVKTLFSIDQNKHSNFITAKNYPDSFTSEERDNLAKYVLSINMPFSEFQFAYIEGAGGYGNIFDLHGQYQNNPRQEKLQAGPIIWSYRNYVSHNNFTRYFDFEPYYTYTFNSDLVKMKSLEVTSIVPSKLTTLVPNINDEVETKAKLIEKYDNYLYQKRKINWINGKYPQITGNANLTLDYAGKWEKTKPVNIILGKSNDFNFLNIYPGNTTQISNIAAGQYQIILIDRYNIYRKTGIIDIKENGTNFYRITTTDTIKGNKINQFNEILNRLYSQQGNDLKVDLSLLMNGYVNATYTGSSNKYYGTIIDGGSKSKEGLIGATLKIVGINIGTQTDLDGNFEIDIPEGINPVLEISYIGYATQTVNAGSSTTITLEPSDNVLQNVVVTCGYGPPITKQNYVGSADVVTANKYELQPTIENDTIQVKINPALTDSSSTFMESLLIRSLRNNFKDDAYWQPDLITDANGKASFKVTFPDDITNWKTFVYATDDKKHTGSAWGNIKSYKPVAASLFLPHFLLDGDTALLIGKSLNYIPDTIPVTTSFYQNNQLKTEHKLQLGAYYTDTLLVTDKAVDSIKLKYLLTKEDGYFDGEERTIPLQRVGVKIAEGGFVALDKKDTSFIVYPNQKSGTLHLSAYASLVDVLLDEIEVVRDYGYMCNEQKASKVLAFLAKQKMYDALQKPFDEKDKKYVQGLINKIINSQNQQHQWGWWDNGTTIPWISNHVVKALTDAKSMGYNCKFDTKTFVENYVYNLERDTVNADISTLQLLAQCNAALNYEKYINRLERQKDLSLSVAFELILLRQQLHLPYKTTQLTTLKESDIFGNIYWKDTARYVYNNEVMTTLNALKIIQNDTSIGIPANKIINWLLQQRTATGWRNTYESSNIIMALAKTISLSNKADLKPEIHLSGGFEEKVVQFPYQRNITMNSALHVQKSGYAPVYFSWYYNKWDTSNGNLGNNFKVNSKFESNNKAISYLPAGVPVTMKVNIHVDKSAEFVMIEIPIPAGCSYQSKEQSYSNYEIHREYFENKVNIFCEKLPKGDYEYKVELLPRYQGSYTLNPAKAELMYFPVFYGREKIKKLEIK